MRIPKTQTKSPSFSLFPPVQILFKPAVDLTIAHGSFKGNIQCPVPEIAGTSLRSKWPAGKVPAIFGDRTLRAFPKGSDLQDDQKRSRCSCIAGQTFRRS